MKRLVDEIQLDNDKKYVVGGWTKSGAFKVRDLYLHLRSTEV
jgi:hypothetical protein